MDAFRNIGTPLDGRTVGVGYCVLVSGIREAGSIDASLRLHGDRYVVDFRVNVKPVTEEELTHIEETGVNPTSLKAFNAMFDLMRLRDAIPTFTPDESDQVVVAIESVFGCS